MHKRIMSFISRNDLHGLRNFLNSLLGKSLHLSHTQHNSHRDFQVPNKTTHNKNQTHNTPTTLTNRFTPLSNQTQTHTPRETYDPKLGKINIQGANHPLSNFYPCRMKFKNVTYPSEEHAYQHTKATFCSNNHAAAAILQAPNAYVAKSIGNSINKQCTNKQKQNWDLHKLDIMRDILRNKFQQSNHFRTALLATGDKKLTHDLIDPFWGSFFSRKQGQLIQQDWFSKLLMDLRAQHQPKPQVDSHQPKGVTAPQ